MSYIDHSHSNSILLSLNFRRRDNILKSPFKSPTQKHRKQFEMGVYPTERATYRDGLLLGAGLHSYNRSRY